MAKKKKRKTKGQASVPALYCTDWDVDGSERLVAVDELSHRLILEQPDGSFRLIGDPGDGPAQFHYPRGVAVLGDQAYVADAWNHRVQVFDLPTGEFRGAFGVFGSGDGEFFCPSGVVVIERGDGWRWLSVADTNNRRVAFHAPDGRFLFSVETGHEAHPRKLRTADGFVEVQYDDGRWSRLS